MADGEVKVIITDDGSSAQTANEIGKTTEALGGVTTATDKTATATEKLGGHSRELHRVTTLMNRILPGSGEALRAFGEQADGAALMFLGFAGALEIAMTAIDKVKAGAKAADESLAQSLSEGGSLDAINAQKKAWEDAEIAEEQYHDKVLFNQAELANKLAAKHRTPEEELKIEKGQVAAVNADEEDAEAKFRTASGALAKHDKLSDTYSKNVATAKSAMASSGVTPEDEQAIREAYEKISGNPSSGAGALDLGAQADYVRNRVTTGTFKIPLGDQLHLLNMFSDFAGGRGLNDANFSAYDLASNDVRRNQGQLDKETSKDSGLKENDAAAKQNLEHARSQQGEIFDSIMRLTDEIKHQQKQHIVSVNKLISITASHSENLKETHRRIDDLSDKTDDVHSGSINY